MATSTRSSGAKARALASHRHDAGALIFQVTGCGYSLLWLDSADPVASDQVDWRLGMLFAPPDGPTGHRHFNRSGVPARDRVNVSGNRRHSMWSKRVTRGGADVSVTQDGMQVEHRGEDWRTLELFQKECENSGTMSQVREFLGRA